ncbi:MAG: muconolactone Delta-isomerase family protein [Betaproteobacteria bacterium]
MLYLLDVEIDYSRMGERIAELREAEHARVGELVREGVVLVEWLKASGRGVFAVWDCPSHEALRRTIASMPMASYLGKVELHPLTEHPLFPGGRTAAYPTPEGYEPR